MFVPELTDILLEADMLAVKTLKPEDAEPLSNFYALLLHMERTDMKEGTFTMPEADQWDPIAVDEVVGYFEELTNSNVNLTQHLNEPDKLLISL